MKFNKGNIVMIIAPRSRYYGFVGEVIDYNEKLKVYIVDTKIIKVGMREEDLILNT